MGEELSAVNHVYCLFVNLHIISLKYLAMNNRNETLTIYTLSYYKKKKQ